MSRIRVWVSVWILALLLPGLAYSIEPLDVVLSINQPTIDASHSASSFVIQKDTLYVTSKWNATGDKPVKYRCEIYDGKQTLAFVMGSRLMSDRPFLYQSNYTASLSIDAPGEWEIVIFANDRAVFSKKIRAVLPGRQGNGEPKNRL